MDNRPRSTGTASAAAASSTAPATVTSVADPSLFTKSTHPKRMALGPGRINYA
jgi:hypothetical protein